MIRLLQECYWTFVPYDWRPKQVWYRFKCWAWCRYSTVKPRELPHTWVDRGHLIPHMLFEILSQFIEKECSPGHVAWYGDWEHRIEVHGIDTNVRDEMQDLYDWWHDDYLVNVDHFFDAWHANEANGVLFRKAYEEEAEYEEELKNRLHRIINILPYMWT